MAPDNMLSVISMLSKHVIRNMQVLVWQMQCQRKLGAKSLFPWSISLGKDLVQSRNPPLCAYKAS